MVLQLKDAQLIYEGESTDVVYLWSIVLRDGSESYILINRAPYFFTDQTFVWVNNKIIKLDIPDDAELKIILNNQLIIQLKSDWKVNTKTYKTGNAFKSKFY